MYIVHELFTIVVHCSQTLILTPLKVLSGIRSIHILASNRTAHLLMLLGKTQGDT
jgi:hypothetical protein